jgi:ribose-phosphate pyrophosphokinase
MYFPAGEAHIKIAKEIENSGPLTQIARIDSADGNDLFTIAQWADACWRREEKTILLMPYLPGARADHSDFVPRGAEVYARFINEMMIDQVICFDPHSPVMPALLNNCTAIDSTRLVRQHIVGKDDDEHPQRYQGIIAPDKGAIARARAVSDACHLPLYLAEKHRDKDTGKLSEFTCRGLPDEGKLLVVDDICDGGGTFMGLAEATGLPMERLGLYVSHGVFSGNASNLFAYYDEIWTTDSLHSADAFIVRAKSQLMDPSRANIIPLATTMNGYIK